jgi:hypothetical protein
VTKKVQDHLGSQPAPARQSKLPAEMIWALEQWNLPTDRVHRLRDYREDGLVKNPGHADRLRELGILKPGHWAGANFQFWYPAETAQMILSFPTERPVPHPGRKKTEATPMPPESATKPSRRRRLAVVETSGGA